MIIGVPKETHRHEHRVGLTPFAVSRLTGMGHGVVVETGAGEAARFADAAYREAGARLVYDPHEVYKRADIVCRVGVLAPDDLDYLKPGLVLCAFHHLAVASPETVERLARLEATVVGYEIIRGPEGELSVLAPFSEMAGRMAIPIAAHHLQAEAGGRGVLMGNVPGVPPPTVLILGGGHVGTAAARAAVAAGVHVLVLDEDMASLRRLSRECGARVVTALLTPSRLGRYTAIADVVVGAVLIPGERAPYLVTREMVAAMKGGSVILDISIDQGGCVETSRPTTLDGPTFAVNDVIHYCVPNMTANVPRTASRALVNAALPYVTALATKGPEAALDADPGLAAGLYLRGGEVVNESLGQGVAFPDAPTGGSEET